MKPLQVLLATAAFAAAALPACERADTTAYDPRIDGLVSQPVPEPDLSILGDQKALHKAVPSGSSASATPTPAPGSSTPARPGVVEPPREGPPILAPPDTGTQPAGQPEPARVPTPAAAAPSPTPTPVVNTTPVDLSSPYSTVRELMLAMLDGDQARVNQCTLEVPGRDILTKGQPSGAALATARQEAQNANLQQLSVGNTVKLPGGKTLTVDDTMVNMDHLLILGPNNPVPFAVVHKGEEWKVDPTTLIAARTAAAK